jgi:ATP-dependent Lon protease
MPQEDVFAEIVSLEKKVGKARIPEELKERAMDMLQRLTRMAKYGFYSQEYEQASRYIDWIINLPWNKRSEDVLDLKHAKQVLDSHHYGLDEIKDRILEYVAVMKLKTQQMVGVSEEERGRELMRAPILFFVGLVGTGKTTISSSIAEAMGRKFERIPFGGMGDALTLRGQSRVRPDAEVGQIVKAIRRAGVKNPVILLDEIDRVAEHARSDIMGVLVELLDPGQNFAFTDHFIDYPFDLSQVLFIATANNTSKISTAVLDRLEVIQMPSYTDDEKIHIGRDYVLPKTLKQSGLTVDELKIDDEVWPKIVRPLGYDAGIRTLERTINGVCRKVARQVVEGKITKLVVNEDNVKEYLPTW